jgi:hypothetical protein
VDKTDPQVSAYLELDSTVQPRTANAHQPTRAICCHQVIGDVASVSHSAKRSAALKSYVIQQLGDGGARNTRCDDLLK